MVKALYIAIPDVFLIFFLLLTEVGIKLSLIRTRLILSIVMVHLNVTCSVTGLLETSEV